MSSNLVVPFNFQPITTHVIATSYTIPSGKYAQIVAEADTGGTLTINGAVAMTTGYFANEFQGNNTSATLAYTVPVGYKAELQVRTSDVTQSAPYIGNTSNPMAATNNSVQKVDLGQGGQVGILGGAGASTKSISGVLTPSNATNRQATFWVPAGTVINGSGNWRAIVVEYNNIT